uniref:Fork-head domain-containing protein n=1 Tax=Cuerna arida TaxID=1464854 RepID=A0A1B6GET1_9HEMI
MWTEEKHKSYNWNLLQNSINIEYNNAIKTQQQGFCDKVKQRLQEFLQSVEGVCTEPPFLYTVLIVMALVSSDKPSLRCSEIFQFIQDKFPFYQNRETWKKSVVVTLELNSFFTKTCGNCKTQGLQDHDCGWCIESATATNILARAFKLELEEVSVIQQTERQIILQEAGVDKDLKSSGNKIRVKREETMIEPTDHPLKTDNRNQTVSAKKLKTMKPKRRISSVSEHRKDSSSDDLQLHLKSVEIHTSDDRLQKETKRTLDSSETKKSQENMTDMVKGQLKELLQSVENICTEPPFSYTVLIVMALVSADKTSVQLSEIFQFIQEQFPFYRDRYTWMNSVRVTLGLNSFFSKVCTSSCHKKMQDHDGCWTIDSLTASQVLQRALESIKNKVKGSDWNINYLDNYKDTSRCQHVNIWSGLSLSIDSKTTNQCIDPTNHSITHTFL